MCQYANVYFLHSTDDLYLSHAPFKMQQLCPNEMYLYYRPFSTPQKQLKHSWCFCLNLPIQNLIHTKLHFTTLGILKSLTDYAYLGELNTRLLDWSSKMPCCDNDCLCVLYSSDSSTTAWIVVLEEKLTSQASVQVLNSGIAFARFGLGNHMHQLDALLIQRWK